MSRYIDADGFFETFSELDVVPYNTYPSTDVVEVVRCKYCIHNHEHETPFGSKFHICNINKLAFAQYADFYCAYGERREDARNSNP